MICYNIEMTTNYSMNCNSLRTKGAEIRVLLSYLCWTEMGTLSGWSICMVKLVTLGRLGGKDPNTKWEFLHGYIRANSFPFNMPKGENSLLLRSGMPQQKSQYCLLLCLVEWEIDRVKNSGLFQVFVLKLYIYCLDVSIAAFWPFYSIVAS